VVVAVVVKLLLLQVGQVVVVLVADLVELEVQEVTIPAVAVAVVDVLLQRVVLVDREL
tara:strand:+ start:404 stop:577 length:174 start_codon:yes stop_codon:yes gene_type:complete